MPRKEGEPKRVRERKLTRDELCLWQKVTENDELLPHAGWVEVEEGNAPVPNAPVMQETRPVPPVAPQGIKPVAPPSTEVNHRQLKRFKSGMVGIDAVLDLHGKGEAEARFAFYAFLEQSLAAGNRCVLVITGKGRHYVPSLFEKQGRLKSQLPEWVKTAPMAENILRMEQAKPRHGGEGAYYILLRRRR